MLDRCFLVVGRILSTLNMYPIGRWPFLCYDSYLYPVVQHFLPPSAPVSLPTPSSQDLTSGKITVDCYVKEKEIWSLLTSSMVVFDFQGLIIIRFQPSMASDILSLKYQTGSVIRNCPLYLTELQPWLYTSTTKFKSGSGVNQIWHSALYQW